MISLRIRLKKKWENYNKKEAFASFYIYKPFYLFFLNTKEMKLFRIIALLEGISYILLIFVAVPIKYTCGDASFVKFLGMPHGLLFMSYVGCSIFYMQNQNWNLKIFLIVLIASIIPFGTFYVDKKYLRS